MSSRLSGGGPNAAALLRPIVGSALARAGNEEEGKSCGGGGRRRRAHPNVTDNVPEEAGCWLALGSIGVSAVLKLNEKDDHWLLRPGR